MGGGVVGNLAAAWFRRRLPALQVTVIGRTDQNLPVVGESLVESSTLFLQEIGLGRHLVERQLPKYGLTFYYKLAPEAPGDARYVVDAVPTNPPLPSFLVNRSSFDDALRRLNRQHGVEHVEGRVTGVALGERAPHRVSARRADGTQRTYEARWLIDATGRRRLLAKQLGLDCGVARQRSSFWFRLADFDASILERVDGATKGLPPPDAYHAAHHFFGAGNWLWLLPLRADDGRRLISVGLTHRLDLFDDAVTCMPEFLDRVAREHPILADFVRSGTVVDTNLYSSYMYGARQRYSARRWFLIGDAAGTVDPLYSSGLALAAAGIQQVGAMIRRDMEGRLTSTFVADLDAAYEGVHGFLGDQVTRLYDVMGDGYECHLRMHLHVAAFFHLAVPLLLNGYHVDEVGAALMARLGRPAGGLARQLTDFEPLVARAAARQPDRSAHRFMRVQSAFAMNHSWFEYRRDEEVPRSLFRMFRHLTALRLRLMWLAGVRSWCDPVQLGALLRSLVWAAAAGGFGRRSLKRSWLIRRLVATS